MAAPIASRAATVSAVQTARPATRYPLPATHYPLPTTHYPLPGRAPPIGHLASYRHSATHGCRIASDLISVDACIAVRRLGWQSRRISATPIRDMRRGPADRNGNALAYAASIRDFWYSHFTSETGVRSLTTISDVANGPSRSCLSLERSRMAIAMPANELDGQTRWTASVLAGAAFRRNATQRRSADRKR